MIFSYNTALSNFSLNNGYGNAGWGVINSLNGLGHRVFYDAPVAPVELTFAQPSYFVPNDHQYQILYTPWESTELPFDWLDKFNSADEVWTTSDWCKQVYIDCGVTRPIHVYPHGIDVTWQPRKKKRNGPIKFLSVGEPANRKGAQVALNAFRRAFGDDPRRATLTIKAFQRNHTRWPDGQRVRDPNELPNVTVDTRMLETDYLIDLFNAHDVNVYPSCGEGMGLIPMQSLAQGTPTICTGEWAHYKKYLGDFAIDSHRGPSKWPGEHEGDMFYPDEDHLVELMLKMEQDYNSIATDFFKQSFDFHAEYDWEKLTQDAFEHIFNRFDK